MKVPSNTRYTILGKCPNAWLDEEMTRLSIRNVELERTLHKLGYETASRSNIGSWRKGDLTIPPGALVNIMDIFGYSHERQKKIVLRAIGEIYPSIKKFLRSANKEKSHGKLSSEKAAQAHLWQRQEQGPLA